ncbi:MAG: LysR family transcriptional regulator [Maritimibacter sp.]|nr:LysR family transcriptional regulator [Maritimibacter sp.]
MKAAPSLDDFALFLAVADAGGLAGAAETCGVSAPTLSRRLTALERDLGETLFQRGAQGYALTARGRALRTEAEPLRALAQRLQTFGAAGAKARARVRITAGHWTSHFLACHLDRVWSPDAPWVPELLASNANLDIARRVADIGIRNRRPEQSWLAGRRTSRIGYAEYATGPEVAGYLAVTEDTPTTPAERWLAATHADEIVTRGSNGRVLLDLARAGIGRVVLPTFAGDAAAGVVRVSPPIEALTHEEWLVAHHEARHDPPVRAALDAVATLLTDTSLRPPLA